MTFVHSDGADINYDVRGTGTPVMLVAGTGYSGQTWHPRLEDLLAQDHTLITFDHRGTGSSSSTAGDYTTELFARDALAVLRQVGLGPAHLIGHSMGGRVAQHMALIDPDLVKSLTLAASGAGLAPELPFERVGIPIGATLSLINDGFEKYVTDKHRSNFFTAEFAAKHPDEVEWLDAAYLKSAPSLLDYLKHVRARQAHSTVDKLADLDVPTFITVGTADTHNGGTGSHLDGAHLLHSLIPQARFHLIEGQRHGFMWEQVEATADLFNDFLDAVDG